VVETDRVKFAEPLDTLCHFGPETATAVTAYMYTVLCRKWSFQRRF